jgi:hypothetical protein
MGSNYYAFTKDRKTAEAMSDRYRLTDEPEFGYLIHICKLFYDRPPLFEAHKHCKSFGELNRHMKNFELIGEGGERIEWKDFVFSVRRDPSEEETLGFESRTGKPHGNPLESSVYKDAIGYEFAPVEFL